MAGSLFNIVQLFLTYGADWHRQEVRLNVRVSRGRYVTLVNLHVILFLNGENNFAMAA